MREKPLPSKVVGLNLQPTMIFKKSFLLAALLTCPIIISGSDPHPEPKIARAEESHLLAKFGPAPKLPDRYFAVPAKKLFGKAKTPAALPPQAIGFYSRGCLAGALKIPANGPAWQAMRLSRNRHWGHPRLIAFLKRFALEVRAYDGWPGLLIGDISQPRGGPMLTGHHSHQLGLDVDIWLMPMPKRRLSWRERETMSAVSVLAKDRISINPKVWSEAHFRVLRRAASYPEVERIFVHPAIKKALCETEKGDRSWLSKVRPWWGHHYHFHVRLKCPEDSPYCQPQKPPPKEDGCGEELAFWLKLVDPRRPKKPPKKPPKPRPPIFLDDLPEECQIVLAAPAPQQATAKATELQTGDR